MIRTLAICLALWPVSIAAALTLDLPATAQKMQEQTLKGGSYNVPLGPYAQGGVPAIPQSGTVSQYAYRIGVSGITTQQILGPLREQLENAGYDVLFSCDTRGCGGFDFRFSTPVLPPPAMFVDLGDFRFLSARSPTSADYMTLMISRSSQAGYLQITQVGKTTATITKAAPLPAALQASGGLVAQLVSAGHVVLDDLAFEPGSSKLGTGPFSSLADLAGFLAKNPDLTLALVGHTDSEGSLDGNINLSRKRAQAVRARMIQDFGSDPKQIEAEGMGYLSPIASNLTDAGREKNRRVEVILTSTQR